MERIFYIIYAFVILIAFSIFFYFLINAFVFYGSEYYKQSKMPFSKVWFNRNKLKIYNISRKLVSLRLKNCKFVYNVFLPYKDKCFEIPAVAISGNGVVLFTFSNIKPVLNIAERLAQNKKIYIIYFNSDCSGKKYSIDGHTVYCVKPDYTLNAFKDIINKDRNILNAEEINSIANNFLRLNSRERAKKYSSLLKIEEKIHRLDKIIEAESKKDT